ncbi:MAG: PTS sugar transporter subunit IIA [Leptospiraceae bacterium]|nr:PTS sugar transporter subunit IIA [Leptospiraceae bacterium]
MNPLLEYINNQNIIYDLKAKDKEEVIRELVTHGVEVGMIEQDLQDEIFTSLINRESSMSTGIGSGVAIPHCSINAISSLIMIIGISRDGIPFDAIDNLPVNIFVMMVVPKNKFQDHIKTLAVIAKTLNLKEERDKLISSKSYDDLVSIISTNSK